MSQLEQAFQADLIASIDRAERECGIRQKRLRADVEKFGAVSSARELFRKRRMSEGFAGLAQAGRLELSLEALAAAGKYGALFTDDEVNACFTALCDSGFYVWNESN